MCVWGEGGTETGAENQLRFDKPTANNQQLKKKPAEGATIQNFNWTSVVPANGQLTVTDDHHGDLCRTV